MVWANDGTDAESKLIEVVESKNEGANTTANLPNDASTDDPVSTATGELYFDVPDLSIGGPFPLSFSRYYAALLLDDGYVSSTLGNNWMHNFDLKLISSASALSVVYYGGKIIEFEKSGTDWTLKNAEPIIYQLIDSGSGWLLLDPSRNLIYSFDNTGKLITIQDRNGNTQTLTYTGDQLARVTDGLGRAFSFSYTGGKLTQVQDDTAPTDPKRSILFTYTGDNLTAYTDAEGHTTSYSYTDAGELVGLMTAQTRPEGNTPFTQTFDEQGRVNNQTDGYGNTLTLDYDTPSEGITTLTDALSNMIQHTHENRKNFTEQQDSDGETFAITYDVNGRRTSLKDRLGDTSSVSYHEATGFISSYTDAMGNTVLYTYTPQAQAGFTFYNLTRIDYPDGSSTAMVYDAFGNMLTLTDPAGDTWNYTYNEMGQVLTQKNPMNGLTSYAYNTDATLSTVEDHFNNITRFTYDSYKRLTQISFPDMTTRTFTYNSNDQLLTVTDENGKTTAFTYNDNGNVATATDPLGNTLAWSYTLNDRLGSITDALGKTTMFAYDELQRIGAVTNAFDETITYAYNSHGWLASKTDPAGKVFKIGYDKEGVISSITDPLNKTTTYSTDKLGRVTGISTPLANAFLCEYDSMGRIVKTTDPLSNDTTYTYDPRGDLSGITMPETITASYTRNELGLITRITDPNGKFWDRSYDEMGRLISSVDPMLNATTYAYDERNRIARIDLPESTLDITYDANGNIIEKSFSDGNDLTFTYDENDRLLAADGLSLSYDERGGIINCNGMVMTRDDLGRIASLALAPGKTITYAYNSRGLVSSVTDWVGGSTAITYDDAGRMIALTRPNGVTTQNTYDNDGRLTGITEKKSGTLSAISLTRDGAGNIISADRDVPRLPEPDAGTVAFSFNDACQVVGYTYDKMGRLTAEDTRTYAWDLASRLASYTESNNTVSFTYDGLGMRLSRTSGGTTREYVWNYALGIPSVSIIREGSGDVRYYVHLPGGRLLYSIDASDTTRHFYHFDEMGNTLFLTDAGGVITDSYGITPYGIITDSTGSTDNPFTFVGAYGVMQEGDSGLYYMRNRYYDAAAIRFLSRDPVKSIQPLRINPYQYAAQNPLSHFDPLGLDNITKGPECRLDALKAGEKAKPKDTDEAKLREMALRDFACLLTGCDPFLVGIELDLSHFEIPELEELPDPTGYPGSWGSNELIPGNPSPGPSGSASSRRESVKDKIEPCIDWESPVMSDGWFFKMAYRLDEKGSCMRLFSRRPLENDTDSPYSYTLAYDRKVADNSIFTFEYLPSSSDIIESFVPGIIDDELMIFRYKVHR